MHRPIAILAAALAISAAACATTSSKTTRPAVPTTSSACKKASELPLSRIQLDVAGQRRDALVHVPGGWDGKRPIPLVLGLHGLGSDAAQQRDAYGITQAADAHQFVAVFPNAMSSGSFGRAWDLKGSSDVTFVKKLLTNIEGRECIDTTRVYVTGMSYGGAMTDKLACDVPNTFAAFAPVSAYLPRICTKTTPAPVISFHGVDDHLVPYDGGGYSRQVPFEKWGAGWAARNGCSPTVTRRSMGSVEQLTWKGCKQPLVLYKVSHNGHTWPGHSLGLNRAALIDVFSGKRTGKPYPLMVALHLTPEQFADTISLTNTQIDATPLIWDFLSSKRLPGAATSHQ